MDDVVVFLLVLTVILLSVAAAETLKRWIVRFFDVILNGVKRNDKGKGE